MIKIQPWWLTSYLAEASEAMMPSGPLPGGMPPQDRDQLLAAAGSLKARIYSMVRTILDDLEAVAPWDGLYYPPTDAQEFLGMENALVAMIRDIPERVGTLTQALQAEASDDAERDLVGNADFYFHGIGVSVASELEKLQAKLDAFRTGTCTLSPVERTFTCEISADLKGKYTSSIMGAAASLIAEGLWQGVEIEPILFPEKAEEFDRNERLVASLSRVTETIQTFLEQVPLAELVVSWKAGRRVDQYALAPLYSLLGDLGKLMQVSSRRALYSGDYHQIQRREVLLSARINELTSLHSMTWKTVAESDSADDGVYAIMVEKAVELAAILDVDILKELVGDSQVKDLFLIVTLEKEDGGSEGSDDAERVAARRQRIPEELHSLISLLYDEDLKTFLELLLGSVLKRASLTIQRQSPQPVAVAPVAEATVAEVAVAEPSLVAPPSVEPSSVAPDVTESGSGVPPLAAPVAEELTLGESPFGEAPRAESAMQTAGSLAAGDSLETLEPPELSPVFDQSLPPEDSPWHVPADDSPWASSSHEVVPRKPAEDSLLADATLIPPPVEFELRKPPSGVASADASSMGVAQSEEPAEAAFLPSAESWLNDSSPSPSQVSPPSPPQRSASETWPPTALRIDPSPPPAEAGRFDALNNLLNELAPLLSRSSSHRKSFELVRRLLNQKRVIPGGLLQSMRPYLYEIMNQVIPLLRDDTRLGEGYPEYGNHLLGYCQLLCDPMLSPEAGLEDVPEAMEQVLDLLNRLAITARSSVERLTST